MDWTTAFGTVLTGLVVVFVALILLILIVTVMGKIMSSMAAKAKAKEEAAKAAAKAAKKKAASDAPAAPAKAAPVITAESMDDEVAAAITAALAVILAEEGSGKSYVVKSIKRVRKGSSAWANAGLAENVRPF